MTNRKHTARISLTAAATYLLKISEISFSDLKTGWKEIQIEIALRDQQAALSENGGPSVQNLLEYAEGSEDSFSSKMFESGCREEIQSLVENELERT